MCSSMELVESSEVEIKKGRGRPRKEVIEVIEEIEPKKKGRPKKVVEDLEPKPKRPRGRPTVENPCKGGKPKEGKKYFRDYYASKIKNCLVNCPNCNALTEKASLIQHMKSKRCAKIADFINVSFTE